MRGSGQAESNGGRITITLDDRAAPDPDTGSNDQDGDTSVHPA
ncbi:hypothetical protein ACGF1Z_35275 [Streptomyces sp. NPDC048018]